MRTIMKKGLLLLSLFVAGHFTLNAQNFTVSPWELFLPSERMPSSVIPQKANNNIDLVKFGNRYYMSFRTAPSHFASKKTQLYILSSLDMENWEQEKEIFLGADMREPRFLVYHDTLYFYFFEGGTHPLKFEPRHFHACHTTGKGDWSTLHPLTDLDGWVPWRLRVREEVIYLSAYYGEGLYQANQQSELRLFTSTDGYHWKKISEEPQESGSSAEEGEFIFDDDGNLWGTIRREDLGGVIVYAHRDSLHKWKKRYIDWKYDSALLFKHENEIYLISRRNLDKDGRVNKAPKWWRYGWQMKYNLLRYSGTRKCTAMFHLNKETMEMEHLMDFPSTGDTAFPGIAPAGKNRYVILNYSNDINGKPMNWIKGQLRPTNIYKAYLTFESSRKIVK